MSVEVKLPAVFAMSITTNGNTIQQIIQPSRSVMADWANFTSKGTTGHIIIPKDADDAGHILVVGKNKNLTVSYSKIILAPKFQIDSSDKLDLSAYSWLKHPDLKNIENPSEHLEETLKSWSKGFSFISEDEENGVFGLREPQEGAIHEIKGHWSVSNDTATIVMPTGTGKTETMISVSVLAQCTDVGTHFINQRPD